MNWLLFHSVALTSVERLLNSLPAGLLVAVCTYLLLRLLRKQNAGTRFAVWFLSLMAVAGLCLVDPHRFLHIGAAGAHSLNAEVMIPSGWAIVLFVVWASAAALGLLRVGMGILQLARVRKSCTRLEASELGPEVEEMLRTCGSRREVSLATSDLVKVPAAIGLWRPIIVLPTWTLEDFSLYHLLPILTHELTHLKRRDDWTNLIQKLVRAVFFFHPVVWWIDARLSIEREMACDDAVLATCSNPQAYAGCLIDLLERSCARKGWVLAQTAVHRARELSLRIEGILDARRSSRTLVWKPALALTATFSIGCLALAGLGPQVIAFRQVSSNSAKRAAEIRHALQSSEDNQSIPAAAVVPASYRVPMKQAKRQTPQQTKQARRQATKRIPALTAKSDRWILTTSETVAADSGDLVFVQTVRYTYGSSYAGRTPHAKTSDQTRVLQIVWIEPSELDFPEMTI